MSNPPAPAAQEERPTVISAKLVAVMRREIIERRKDSALHGFPCLCDDCAKPTADVALGGCGDREGVAAFTIQPKNLIIQGTDGEPLARINLATGVVSLSAEPDEAARAFWNAIEGEAKSRRALASSLRTPEPTPDEMEWQVTQRAADRLAGEVCHLVDSHQLDARSRAGDAMLDYACSRHGDANPIGNLRLTHREVLARLQIAPPNTSPSALRGTEAESTRELCARCVGEGCDRCDGSGYEGPASSTPAERPE